MACSSADWVFGLARLISSAISSWAKIGPLTKRKLRRPPALSSSTSEPMMSEGIRSGVNWMRLASSPRIRAQRLHQQGLGEARHADQQGMAAAEERDQGVLDHLLLAEDDGACRLVHALDTLAGRLDAGDDGFIGLGECAHDPELYMLRGSFHETVSAMMVTIWTGWLAC